MNIGQHSPLERFGVRRIQSLGCFPPPFLHLRH